MEVEVPDSIVRLEWQIITGKERYDMATDLEPLNAAVKAGILDNAVDTITADDINAMVDNLIFALAKNTDNFAGVSLLSLLGAGFRPSDASNFTSYIASFAEGQHRETLFDMKQRFAIIG